jgi:hypothetical protein
MTEQGETDYQRDDTISITEDLISNTEDLISQTEDLISQTEDLISQTEDRISNTEDTTSQSEDQITKAGEETSKEDTLFEGTVSLPALTFTSEWYYENPEADSDSHGSGSNWEDLDILSAHDSFNAESDTDNESPRVSDRRSSKWSATILFVASEIQMIIDLAEFCPDEKYLTAPNKVSYCNV